MARVRRKKKPYSTRPKLRFKPRAGAPINSEQAQAVGERLMEMAEGREVEGNASLSTEEILEEGMNPSSPLHFWFEGDETAAAHQYRLIQARRLPRSIEVVGVDGKGDMASWTAFASIPVMGDGSPGRPRVRYVPVSVLKEKPGVKALVVARARSSIQAATRELRRLEDLDDIVHLLTEADMALEASV